MKKRLFTFTLIFALAFSFYGQSNDLSLYNEILHSYRSKSYPTVIQAAVRMQSDFPHSIYLAKSYAYKSEALYRMERYDEVLTAAWEALRSGENDSQAKVAAFYWRGRTYEKLEKFDQAKSDYENAILLLEKVSDERSVRLSNLSYFRQAELFYSLEDFEKSIPYFEYVIYNGENFSSEEYEKSSLHLSLAYINFSHAENQIELYEKLLQCGAKEKFSKKNFEYLTLYYGHAFKADGQYKKAYDIYIQLLNEGDSEMASLALTNAYSLAFEKQKEVGEEPGSVLQNAQKKLSEYPELLANVWTRLGIDAFNSGDKKKAASYFDNAEKEGPYDFLQVIGPYRAEMAGEKSDGVKKALSFLDEYFEKYNVNEKPFSYDSYAASYTKFYALDGDFEKAVEWGKGCGKKESLYYYALSLYKCGKSLEAEKVLSKEKLTFSRDQDLSTYKRQILYARLLAENNKLNDSLLIYESQQKMNLLKKEDMYDYALLLYKCGYYSSAFKIAQDVNEGEALCLAGLASVNRNDWKNAERYLTLYNKENENAYSLYYSSYAQYRLQKNQSAYKGFCDFIKKYPDSELIFDACYFASHTAVLLSDYDAAETMASKALENKKSESDYERAAILLSLILKEEKKYDQALALLKNDCERNDAFGVTVRYEMADIYVKKNELISADEKYNDIFTNFSLNPLADDAGYRRAEIFYAAGNYSMSISRYLSYIEKIKNGKFSDAANFYLADSYARSAQNNKAIMQYLVFLELFPQSNYRYTAKKNLLSLYKEAGDYENALSLANEIVAEYSDAADSQENANQVVTLTHLANGEDEDIYELQRAYENAGSSKTLAGRIKGSELAEALWKSVENQERAFSLAKSLYAIQIKKENIEKESSYAAKNLLILAQHARQNGQNKEAAQYYLERAKYCRMTGWGEAASQALYGAAEAFDAGSYFDDSEKTYQTLLELYPESPYTKAAETLIKG